MLDKALFSAFPQIWVEIYPLHPHQMLGMEQFGMLVF